MEVTIVVPISRSTFLKQFFDCLNALECNQEETQLFVYIDGKQDLLEKVRMYLVSSKFASKVISFRNRGIGTVNHVRKRRQRIADIHNEMRSKIPYSEYLFLLEDDTVFPPDALTKLLENHKYNQAGIVSGVEIGRWGFPILGAWEKYQDTIISSPCLFNPSGLRPVSATGLYCCVVKRSEYVAHTFKPYEKILGPDVDFGLTLKEKGLDNFINYDIKCTHLMQKGELNFQNTKIVQIKFKRDPNDKSGWSHEIL